MGTPRLFHFSDDGSIGRFEPRPVRVPAQRAPGQEWLNGPLVWAVDEDRQATYCFPRDCPRILLWQTAETTSADVTAWWGSRSCRMLAYVETTWLPAMESSSLFRYELGTGPFRPTVDEWMWVSPEPVEPIDVVRLDDLPAVLASLGVELCVVDELAPLRAAFDSTLHVSGIRLRNAATWA
jgi:hypothetical protein